MPIAELFLGAFLQVLFDRLASGELLNFARREGIVEHLKKWERLLTSIDQVLVDAEDKQLDNVRGVKSWLEDVRDLAYDIEDLLDEFAIESAENKPTAEPSTSKVRSLLPSCCFRLSPRELMLDHTMRSKINEMDGRLERIISRKDSLSLGEFNGERSVYRQPNKPNPTTSGTEPCFVSREDEKKGILKLLATEEDHLEVIAIVGMGGVGKTALAQQVYNDDTLTFDKKAWACVSDDFNVPSITKSVLETTSPSLSCEGKTLNWLQDELNKSLSGKKFLVVLDDVWRKNYEDWSILLKPFQSGAKGSKIIITTRDLNVAGIARAQCVTLEVLSSDDCMILFAFHALGVLNFNDHRGLEVLGRKIVEKCKGLPLAVKALAGILCTKVGPLEWEAILNSKIWDLSEEQINVLPALKLSYLHLPSPLRRCFAYCAIFPKDYEIQRDELIRWWIAEGLVEAKEGKNCWNTGLEYFGNLVSRSLFQKSSSDASAFLMHDLVNDLAKLVAGATYFSSGDIESEHGQNNASLNRHASFIPSRYIASHRFKIYHGMKKLRSFILLPKLSQSNERHYLSMKALCDMLSRLKYLRVISLQNCNIKEVPDCIGKMRHLRYLNLSHTFIEMLPEWIGTLYNLEALMLRGCHNLTILPDDVGKLINLKFLDITDTPKLRAMAPYIGKLVDLKMLTKFIVGMAMGSRLEELKDLKNLEGELCISDLHMVGEARDAMDVDLRTTNKISRLTMQWCEKFQNPRNDKLEEKVLEFLCPHQNLENLTISYYGGLEFPPWLGSPSHVNIVYLRLHGCQRVKALPSLGQLSSLKELYIQGLDAISTIRFEFCGTGTESLFPSLRTLEFEDMPSWRNWTHSIDAEDKRVVFPCLKHLVIRNCPMLIGSLPSRLDSLIKLDVDSCLHTDGLLSISSLPSLNELKLRCCNEGVLNKLIDLTSLTALAIEDVADLTCKGFTRSLKQLKELEMRRCGKLMHLWRDRDAMQNLVCLKKLVIEECCELISFTPGEGDMELPSNLETIKLINCVNLEKLPSKMHTLSSLRKLTIYECPKLVPFPEAGSPKSVTSLYINGCEMLWSLPIGLSNHPDEPRSSSSNHPNDMTCYPQEITINECNSLPVPASPFSVPIFLPVTLKTLEIWKCKGVESLAEINVEPLQSLQHIRISKCEKLRSLPRGLHTLSHLTSLEVWTCPALELECFPPLPPAISEFGLMRCPKIKALPHQLHRLTCLRDLSIDECESITRFSDGGLPPQLQSLVIVGCENMKQPVREWEWLPHLTSLEELTIDGSVGGVGEEEDLRLPLPSSLLQLYIYDMKKVKRLCSPLPPSLRTLSIEDCPKLRELPLDDGLPPSLEQLWIFRSEILKERFMKRTGCYRHLIREIPFIRIDHSDLSDSIDPNQIN